MSEQASQEARKPERREQARNRYREGFHVVRDNERHNNIPRPKRARNHTISRNLSAYNVNTGDCAYLETETCLRCRLLSHMLRGRRHGKRLRRESQTHFKWQCFWNGEELFVLRKVCNSNKQTSKRVKLNVAGCGGEACEIVFQFSVPFKFTSRGVKCFWLVVFASLVVCRTKSFKIGYCRCRRYCFSLPVYVLSFRRFFISPVHCLLHFDTSFVCLLRAEISFRITSGTHAACFVYLSQWPKNCATNTNGDSPASLTIMESLPTHTTVFAVNILISFLLPQRVTWRFLAIISFTARQFDFLHAFCTDCTSPELFFFFLHDFLHEPKNCGKKSKAEKQFAQEMRKIPFPFAATDGSANFTSPF